MSLWHIFHALVHKFLHTLAFIRFRCVDVVLRVCCYAVWSIELSWLSSATAKTNQYFLGLTINYVNFEVLTIREVDVLLLLIV